MSQQVASEEQSSQGAVISSSINDDVNMQNPGANGNNNNNNNNNNSSNNDDSNNINNNENDNKNDSPPKVDVTLTLSSTPEFNSYPYHKENKKFSVMASVKASYFRAKDRAPIDLCCVVDESSSMGGDRIQLVKETLNCVVKNMESTDRLGIIGYHSYSRQVLALTKMDKNGREIALKRIDELRPQGCTALCAGLLDGVDMMRRRNKNNSNPVSSIMLFTDGQANEGYRTCQEIGKAMRNPAFAAKEGVRREFGNNNNTIEQEIDFFGRNVQQNRSVPIPNQQQQQQQVKPQAPQNSFANFFGIGSLFSSNKAKKTVPSSVPSNLKQAPQAQQQVQGQGQVQGQAQQQQIQAQQVQGQVQGQQVQGQIDDEKKEENNNNSKEGENELPCIINTFGFGANHNANLLEQIAEDGRGMYVFIENKSMIAESFAECMGGLVSIVGKNLKLKVSSLNGCIINKCLSEGYNINVINKENCLKTYEISIHDIQSEENRDILFEFTIPKIDNEKNSCPIAQISCEFENVVKKKNEILSQICTINRILNDEIGERNEKLDLQHNRILAAEAMECADKLANKGDLIAARKILDVASKNINKSKTGKNKFSQNLINDISRCNENMSSMHQYSSHGTKMLKMNKNAHRMQRSVQSSANWQSQAAYSNCSKAYYRSNFQ